MAGHKGLLIVPDDWNLTDKPLRETYSEDTWKEAEEDGAVFLPYCYGVYMDGTCLIIPTQAAYELYCKMEDVDVDYEEFAAMAQLTIFCRDHPDPNDKHYATLTTQVTGNVNLSEHYAPEIIGSMRLAVYVE